jgi:hypothetical protein
MAFIWTHQAHNKSQWQTFTTPTGKLISLAPRRYIMMGTASHPITQEQLIEAHQFLDEHHTLAAAPEPLSRTSSHLQIFHWTEDNTMILISLTNTSSRTIRLKIFSQLIRLLNITPGNILIQEENENNPGLLYSILHITTLQTILLETKKKQRGIPLIGTAGHSRMEDTSNRITETSQTTTIRHTDGEDDTDNPNQQTPYTFIIHKTGLTNLPPTTKKSPTFAAFDHGDHYHFVFSTKHSNNCSRHLNTILNFIHANFEGIAEANTTLQPIKFITRFISYLIRKGLGSFYKYGARILHILKPLTEALLRYDTTDNKDPPTMYCNQYIEEKKQAKKETITSRTFSIDYISNLITSNNITSYETFQRTLPTQTKIQLLKQLGYVGQNIIKTLIKIHTIEKLQNIKTHHFYDIMIHNFDASKAKQENIQWIQNLFTSNGINIDNFFSDFILIHSTAITKINTLVIEGPTNTGKSLLINLLLSDTHPTRIARERDKSNFHLDQLPNATAVVFEEPIIDQTTIGTWKLLLEGAPIPTDMKHADKEIINRLPIFVTTNHPIWNWVSTEDIAPLKYGYKKRNYYM